MSEPGGVGPPAGQRCCGLTAVSRASTHAILRCHSHARRPHHKQAAWSPLARESDGQLRHSFSATWLHVFPSHGLHCGARVHGKAPRTHMQVGRCEAAAGGASLSGAINGQGASRRRACTAAVGVARAGARSQAMTTTGFPALGSVERLAQAAHLCERRQQEAKLARHAGGALAPVFRVGAVPGGGPAGAVVRPQELSQASARASAAARTRVHAPAGHFAHALGRAASFPRPHERVQRPGASPIDADG